MNAARFEITDHAERRQLRPGATAMEVSTEFRKGLSAMRLLVGAGSSPRSCAGAAAQL